MIRGFVSRTPGVLMTFASAAVLTGSPMVNVSAPTGYTRVAVKRRPAMKRRRAWFLLLLIRFTGSPFPTDVIGPRPLKET